MNSDMQDITIAAENKLIPLIALAANTQASLLSLLTVGYCESALRGAWMDLRMIANRLEQDVKPAYNRVQKPAGERG